MTGHEPAAIAPPAAITRAPAASVRRPPIAEPAPYCQARGAHASGAELFEAPKRPPLASSLDFLSVMTVKSPELRPDTRASGIGAVESDGVVLSQTLGLWPEGRFCHGHRPPVLRQGRMELQGCGIDAPCLAIIVEHLARRHVGVSDSAKCSASSPACPSQKTGAQTTGDEEPLLSLHLSDNNLQAQASLAIARELRHNVSLKYLDLSSNSIGDQGASALSAVLVANTTLETLEVASNGVTHRGIECLSAGMRMNSSLKSLELSFNGFGDVACAALGDVLQQNSTLQYLGLGFNGIMWPGSRALARGITISCSLERLELSYNALGDLGAAELAGALKSTSVLATLGLVSNGITDVGASSLAEALAGNQSLAVLGLSSNQIGDAGASELARALRRNQTLRGLYLEENDIGEAGASELRAVHETTMSCKNLAPELQLAVVMGLNRRLGAQSKLFSLDAYICREILSMCDERRPRDILYYSKVADQKPPPSVDTPHF